MLSRILFSSLPYCCPQIGNLDENTSFLTGIFSIGRHELDLGGMVDTSEYAYKKSDQKNGG